MQLVESSDEERLERKKDEESAERKKDEERAESKKAGAPAVPRERRFGSHGILKLRSSEHRAEADRSEADKKIPEEEGKNVAEGEKTVAEDKNGILPAPILTRTCPIKNPKIISNYQNWLGSRSHDFVSFCSIPNSSFSGSQISRFFSNGLGPGPSLGRAWAGLGPGLGQAWAWVLGWVKSGPRAWMCTPGVINSRKMGSEKSQILGQAWAGFG